MSYNKHESYGMLSFGRTSGGNPNMFGSSINHNNKISLEISTSRERRDFSSEYYYPDRQLIRVEMTYTQFAEAIASMNTTGVPCTIMRFDGKRIEDCPPQEVERVKIRKDYEEKMKGVGKLLSDVLVMSKEMWDSKKAPTKKEREALYWKIHNAEQEIRANAPFMMECFEESIDKVLVQAKGEFEAFVQNKIHSLGIKGLENEVQLRLEQNE